MRKLIVDGQLFQTPAWHRGMGKYSLELLASLIDKGLNTKWNSIELILSEKMPRQENTIAALTKKLKGIKITFLDLLPNEIGNENIPKWNRHIISAYINEQYGAGQSIDFLILSLLQGEIYPCFPTSSNITKSLIFYDLIPLMFHDIYLGNPITRVEYLSKIQELIKADVYLAISKTVANDLALYLGIDRHRIVNIDGGPINHKGDKLKPLNIPKPFILMPTGNDLRKNNQRAIAAFEEFNQAHNHKYSLIVTSFFKDHEVEHLKQFSSDVIFTGNVQGEELSYLYDKAELILFPPEYEGLGLPILEAIEYGKRVACSDISVFREMSESAFNYFNPYSITEICEALERSIMCTPDKKEYANILARYTWTATAQKAMRAITNPPPKVEKQDRRIAIYGPNPSSATGAGKLMQDMHAEFSRLFATDYFIDINTDNYSARINYLPYITNCKLIERGYSFDAKLYDTVLYHLDDSRHSALTLIAALAIPGIVILHDLDLKKVWQAAFEQQLISKSRLKLETAINKSINSKHANYLGSIVARQKTVIVFSDYAKRALENVASIVNPRLNVIKADMPVCNVVYRSALPPKTITIRNADERADMAKTDYRNNEELSKTKVILGQSLSEQEVLEAMSLAVIPFLESRSVFHDLLTAAGIMYDKGTDVNNLLSNSTLVEEYGIKAIEYVQQYHTQTGFSGLLQDLIASYSARNINKEVHV